MKNRLIIIAFLISATSLFAQTEKTFNNNLSLDLGYNQGYMKDLNFSPLNYTQGGKLLGLNYQKNGANGKNRIESGLHLSAGKLNTAASDYFKTSYILATFDASFLRKIHASDDAKLTYFVGGEYKSSIQYMAWKGTEAISFIATHGIAIKGLVTYKLSEKQQLESSLAIPIVQNLVRPPYNTIDQFISENSDDFIKIATTGTPSSLGKYQEITWKTQYKLDLSRHFALNLTYAMQLQHVSDIHSFTQLNNQFLTSFTFKF
jgi:hypothetical protein